MKAGFYQFAPEFGEKSKNLEKVSLALKEMSADLVVLPEFFATGYQFISKDEVKELSEEIPGGGTTKFLEGISKKKNAYIVAGLPEKAGDNFYNSAVITGPEGYIGTYRKIHLYFEEKLFFTPGDTGFKVWDTRFGRLGVMICFDWFFPESMRTLALMGAEVIAHPSNLVLPFCPQAMPIRCLENRVFSVTANRTGTEQRKPEKSLHFIGQSVIAGPQAQVFGNAGGHDDALMVVELDLKNARNKRINLYNDIFEDRRPEFYFKPRG